jgi:hypothetical protein
MKNGKYNTKKRKYSKKNKKTKKLKFKLSGGNRDTLVIMIWDSRHGKNQLYENEDRLRYISDELILGVGNYFPEKNIHIFGEGLNMPVDKIGVSMKRYNKFKKYIKFNNVFCYPEVCDLASACKKIGGGLAYLNLYFFKVTYEELIKQLREVADEGLYFCMAIQEILNRFPEYVDKYKQNNRHIPGAKVRAQVIMNELSGNISSKLLIPIGKFMEKVFIPYIQIIQHDMKANRTTGNAMFKQMKELLFWFNNSIVGILTLPLQDKFIREDIHMPSKESAIVDFSQKFDISKLKNIEQVRDDHFINHILEVNKSLTVNDIIVVIMGSRHKQYERWTHDFTQFSKVITLNNTESYYDWITELKENK